MFPSNCVQSAIGLEMSPKISAITKSQQSCNFVAYVMDSVKQIIHS